MLTARDISVSIGGQPVLAGVSVSVVARTRLGVVGGNGIGKSTLLRVLAGTQVPESGTVSRSPADLQVGYLAQEPDPIGAETLAQYLARRTGVAAAGAELDRLTEALAEDPSALDAYSTALDRFVSLGGDDIDARAGSVCAELGLGLDRMDVPVADLSGGQASRAGLAAILLARFDVFLLDEPTNNLDFEGLERLEGFVASASAAFVVVSHDRAFLDRSVTRILEIESGSRRGAEHAGGWAEFVQRRALLRSQNEEAYRAFSQTRDQLSERMSSQRSWADQGVRKAKKAPKDNDKAQRGFVVNRTEKQASKVRASEKALGRLAQVDKPWEGWELHLSLGGVERSGDVVARLDHATVELGSFVLGPVDLEVAWRDRLAVVGPNGGGKSTLLSALFGTVALSSGHRSGGSGAVVGTIDQSRQELALDATLAESFVDATGLLVEPARSLLAKFGLGQDHIGRRVGDLSPGERTRALLAVLMARGVNTLVLDEPTNHLDVAAIEQLESALDSFDGTLVIVSHDRQLLEGLRLTGTIEVKGGQVTVARAEDHAVPR